VNQRTLQLYGGGDEWDWALVLALVILAKLMMG
jgi:hypothetical protein